MDTVYAPKTGLYLPGTNNNYISTPDHVDLDIIGDFSVIIATNIKSLQGTQCTLIYKANTSGPTALSYGLIITAGRTLLLYISDGSSLFTYGSGTFTIPFDERYVFAITVDIDNGSNSVCYFWSQDAYSGVWQQEYIFTADIVSSIYNTPYPMYCMQRSLGSTGIEGIIEYIKLYDGIGDNSAPGLGTLVAEFDASKCKPRYKDSTGKIWSVTGSDVVTERVYNA